MLFDCTPKYPAGRASQSRHRFNCSVLLTISPIVRVSLLLLLPHSGPSRWHHYINERIRPKTSHRFSRTNDRGWWSLSQLTGGFDSNDTPKHRFSCGLSLCIIFIGLPTLPSNWRVNVTPPLRYQSLHRTLGWLITAGKNKVGGGGGGGTPMPKLQERTPNGIKSSISSLK